MDPLTILALAKGSYEAIKTGVKLGKEIQGLMKDVSSLYDSCAKLTKISAEPPPLLWGKGSAEKQALDAFMAKKEAEKLYEEVKNLVVSEYGLTAWDQIQKEITRIKKAQKEAALKARKEAEEFRRELILWGGTLLGLVILVFFIFLTIYLRYS